MEKKLNLLLLLPAVLILSSCGGIPGFPSPSDSPATGQNLCYNLETNVTVDFTNPCYNVGQTTTYYRIRQQVAIVKAKIDEGSPYAFSCTNPMRLREIGVANGKPVYWEGENYQGEPLEQFILILKEIDTENKKYIFDVYIDSTQAEHIPEFVKNCQETGGLVPVLEPPGVSFPSQFINPQLTSEGGDIQTQTADQAANHANSKNDFAPVYIKLEKVTEILAAARQNQIGVFEQTIGTETRMYNIFFHAGVMYLEDQKLTRPDEKYLYNLAEEVPNLSGPALGLHLQALKFVSTATWTWATPECKPAIYLYPPTKTSVDLKINPQGEVTTSLPTYPIKSGWQNLEVNPHGLITYQGRHYPYLYYEAETVGYSKPAQGSIIPKARLEPFLRETLPTLGLQGREIDDFVNYWITRLQPISKPFLFISFFDQETINSVDPVELTPVPDKVVRIRAYFKPTDSKSKVKPQTLPSPLRREGFTLVEWGGILDLGE